MCVLGLLRLLRRRRAPQQHLEGEEYEIERAEREAQRNRDRYAESLLEKAGHRNYPFLEDPFD